MGRGLRQESAGEYSGIRGRGRSSLLGYREDPVQTLEQRSARNRGPQRRSLLMNSEKTGPLKFAKAPFKKKARERRAKKGGYEKKGTRARVHDRSSRNQARKDRFTRFTARTKAETTIKKS